MGGRSLVNKIGEIYREYLTEEACEKELVKLFSLGIELATTDRDKALAQAQADRDKALTEAIANAVGDKITPKEIDPAQVDKEFYNSFYPSLVHLGKAKEIVEGDGILDSLYPTMKRAN